jgi:hypothetical protein
LSSAYFRFIDDEIERAEITAVKHKNVPDPPSQRRVWDGDFGELFGLDVTRYAGDVSYDALTFDGRMFNKPKEKYHFVVDGSTNPTRLVNRGAATLKNMPIGGTEDTHYGTIKRVATRAEAEKIASMLAKHGAIRSYDISRGWTPEQLASPTGEPDFEAKAKAATTRVKAATKPPRANK